jgi:hypothetical protein
MKFLKIFRKQNRKAVNVNHVGKITDFYQDSIEKIGRDQFKKLVERGLSIPVFAL